MLVLTIRTDKPEAELGLYRDGHVVGSKTWQAHRQLAETLHVRIEELLQACDARNNQLQAIAVFKGPGSFTGLRIGISVANALAYSLGIQVVAEENEDWAQVAIKRLQSGDNEVIAMPEYGAAPHITQQRK